MEGLDQLLLQVQEWLALYGLKLVSAVVILVIGIIVAKYITKSIKLVMTKAKVDAALVTFGGKAIKLMLYAVVTIAALNQVGFQTASLIAVLGGAVFAVGMALQGNVSSIASGVLLLMFRPFNLGDTINCAGITGTVEKIDIIHTKIKQADGRTVIMPNNKLTTDTLTNYSAREVMRADMVIGIGYGDDIAKAKSVIHEVLAAYPKALKDPEPLVFVMDLGDNSVNLGVRPYVEKGNYWSAKWDLAEAIKLRFDEEGINIPYPQRDVHHHYPEGFPGEKPAGGME